MKKIIIFFFIFVLLSCSKDNTQEDLILNSPYLGEYKIISLISDTPLDLNRDGLATNNFIVEISQYFNLYFNYNMPTLLINKGDSSLTNSFYDFIPKQDVNEWNIEDIDFINSGPLKGIRYNNDFTQVLEIDNIFNEEEYFYNKWAIIDEIILLENKKILVKYRQQYFTVETGWKICYLDAIYEKM